MKPDKDQIKHEIKQIIYGCAKKGGVCENLSDGQILGFRTGEGLEFDMVTLVIAEWYCDKAQGILNEVKSLLLKS